MFSTYNHVKGQYLPVDGVSFHMMKARARFYIGSHPNRLRASWARWGFAHNFRGKACGPMFKGS